ncbi:MAG: SRPBCC family protein [Rhodothalassiaceae bacterium]
MGPIIVTRDVQASPDAVFTIVADIPGRADRLRAIRTVEMLSDKPVGQGTHWRETRVLFGSASTEEMTITSFDPPHAFQVESESYGTHYTIRYEVTPMDAGARIRISFAAKPLTMSAMMALPLAWFMRRTTRKMLRWDLDQLADQAEGKQTPETPAKA